MFLPEHIGDVFTWEHWWCFYLRTLVMFLPENIGDVFTWEHWRCLYLRTLVMFVPKNICDVFTWEHWWCVLPENIGDVFTWEYWWCFYLRKLVMFLPENIGDVGAVGVAVWHEWGGAVAGTGGHQPLLTHGLLHLPPPQLTVLHGAASPQQDIAAQDHSEHPQDRNF